MSRKIFLDLDGVMADFDEAYPRLFGHHHKSVTDDEMWSHINAHGTYFRDLRPCPGALEFYRAIRHLDPIILTACPKSDYRGVALQKRAWVRQNLDNDVLICPVMGGKNKPLFMHAAGDILIDDWDRNIIAWESDGGIGIHHQDHDFEATTTLLEFALRGSMDQLMKNRAQPVPA